MLAPPRVPLTALALVLAPLAPLTTGCIVQEVTLSGAEPPLEARTFIAAEYEDVWERFTDADAYAAWYSTPCREFPTEEGEPIVWGTDERVYYRGELLELTPGEGLVHTFQFVGFDFDEPATPVDVRIVDTGPTVLVHVRHDTTGAPRTREMINDVGWQKSLSRLKTLLETGTAMPWPEATQ